MASPPAFIFFSAIEIVGDIFQGPLRPGDESGSYLVIAPGESIYLVKLFVIDHSLDHPCGSPTFVSFRCEQLKKVH